jgi:WD40 repeat protein
MNPPFPTGNRTGASKGGRTYCKPSQLNAQRPERTGGQDLRGFEWHYLWRLAHSDLLTFERHIGRVSSVCFSPDGTRLDSASQDKTVKVWDTQCPPPREPGKLAGPKLSEQEQSKRLGQK